MARTRYQKIQVILSVLHQVCSVILLTVILHATICMSDTYSVPDHLFLTWAIKPDYHIINYPFTHEFLPNWAENEKVLHHLQDTVKTPPSIIPQKPSKIDDLVNPFSNTLNSLPPKKKIRELCSRISTQNYFTATFQWSSIV